MSAAAATGQGSSWRATEARPTLRAMTRVKICGLTRVADALMCVDAGADAIGLNFWSGSVRRCEESVAREISARVGGQVLIVGVFVDATREEMARVQREVGLACLQLHGDEAPDLLAQLLPHAYKALRVRGPGIAQEAARYAGEHVLLDAYVKGVPGGTGATFDWALAAELARARKLTLAGGLVPDNVAQAVRAVRPYCVDTASGVERAPGIKDAELVRAFVANAKNA
jgi:phosphoribosylanthranilate isomerase